MVIHSRMVGDLDGWRNQAVTRFDPEGETLTLLSGLPQFEPRSLRSHEWGGQYPFVAELYAQDFFQGLSLLQ